MTDINWNFQPTLIIFILQMVKMSNIFCHIVFIHTDFIDKFFDLGCLIWGYLARTEFFFQSCLDCQSSTSSSVPSSFVRGHWDSGKSLPGWAGSGKGCGIQICLIHDCKNIHNKIQAIYSRNIQNLIVQLQLLLPNPKSDIRNCCSNWIFVLLKA